MAARKQTWNDPWLRAGIFGFPFCCWGAITTREPVYLLGLGFFAAFLFPGLYALWRDSRKLRASTQRGKNATDVLPSSSNSEDSK